MLARTPKSGTMALIDRLAGELYHKHGPVLPDVPMVTAHNNGGTLTRCEPGKHKPNYARLHTCLVCGYSVRPCEMTEKQRRDRGLA